MPARRDQLHSTYGVTTETDNARAVQGASVVVLAVKPQVLEAVLSDLSSNLPPPALVLSIMAGVQIVTLRDGLGHEKIVRSMPNTPAQVGQGMTVWTDTASVSDTDRACAQTVLEAMGEAIYVADEHYLDMATGLSGSGPGFVYLLLEALIDAGVHIGFQSGTGAADGSADGGGQRGADAPGRSSSGRPAQPRHQPGGHDRRRYARSGARRCARRPD